MTAATVYDVLHDSAYRKKWDKHVVMTDEIGYIDQNNDVCYYAGERCLIESCVPIQHFHHQFRITN